MLTFVALAACAGRVWAANPSRAHEGCTERVPAAAGSAHALSYDQRRLNRNFAAMLFGERGVSSHPLSPIEVADLWFSQTRAAGGSNRFAGSDLSSKDPIRFGIELVSCTTATVTTGRSRPPELRGVMRRLVFLLV